jgi:ergothioneine biosynthesis protein EgtB
MRASPGRAADSFAKRHSEVSAERYRAVRAASERLAAPLSAEDCAVQSMPDASPVKWHLAHTTWFFETFVLEAAASSAQPFRPFQPAFRVLFNSYYESVGAQHPRERRGLLTRPSLAEVLAYRAHVDAALLGLLASGIPDDLARVVEIGLHHEQQHQELILTDVKHLLASSPLRPAYASTHGTVPAASTSAAFLAWHSEPAGLRWIGHEGEGFAFDNEGRRHRVHLEAFELASRPVTSGEFLAFMDDGGYRRPELWMADGFAAVRSAGWDAPLYWERRDGAWWQHSLAGLQPLRPEEPVVHVSWYEADAYASWAGARLPAEAEWECVAAARAVEGNFVESGLLHPAPCTAQGPGPHQLFGDVWEWTRSPYVPYPGYRPPAGALGEYNGKFMANQWVLRGGSCATPQGHVRASYRNFFHPQQRWQFSGFRLARDA